MSGFITFYDQWRNNRSYKCTIVTPGSFHQSLLAGDVDVFDFTQDCNMGGTYMRCFYTLIGQQTVYQETPCVQPLIVWKRMDGKLIQHYSKDHKSTWVYIQDNYTCNESDFQKRYERKPIMDKKVN